MALKIAERKEEEEKETTTKKKSIMEKKKMERGRMKMKQKKDNISNTKQQYLWQKKLNKKWFHLLKWDK